MSASYNKQGIYLSDRIEIVRDPSRFRNFVLWSVLFLAVTVFFMVMADGWYMLYPIAVTGALLGIMAVRAVKEYKRLKMKVVISPKGISYDSGTLIPADEIDHCLLHHKNLVIREVRHSSTDTSFFRIEVYRKDGKKKFIDLNGYKINPKEAETFPEKASAIPGLPRFETSIIELF